jgi:hypothetical protein
MIDSPLSPLMNDSSRFLLSFLLHSLEPVSDRDDDLSVSETPIRAATLSRLKHPTPMFWIQGGKYATVSEAHDCFVEQGEEHPLLRAVADRVGRARTEPEDASETRSPIQLQPVQSDQRCSGASRCHFPRRGNASTLAPA